MDNVLSPEVAEGFKAKCEYLKYSEQVKQGSDGNVCFLWPWDIQKRVSENFGSTFNRERSALYVWRDMGRLKIWVGIQPIGMRRNSIIEISGVIPNSEYFEH